MPTWFDKVLCRHSNYKVGELCITKPTELSPPLHTTNVISVLTPDITFNNLAGYAHIVQSANRYGVKILNSLLDCTELCFMALQQTNTYKEKWQLSLPRNLFSVCWLSCLETSLPFVTGFGEIWVPPLSPWRLWCVSALSPMPTWKYV